MDGWVTYDQNVGESMKIQASKRISDMNINSSDGWEVFSLASKLVSDGYNITELCIGQHDIGTDPRILKAMHRSAMAGNIGYPTVPGKFDLRKAVAARVQARTGVTTNVENVIITSGGQAGLFSSHLATCDPGDKALFIEPYYATYPSTLRALNLNALAVPTKASESFEPKLEVIEPAARGARSLLINSPNNPSGAVYSKSTHEMIAQVCQKHNLWLISDEVYDTQIWSGRHISPRALPNMKDRTLVIGSMSKSHAMTGSRVGWIVGPERIIDKLADLSTNITYGVPGFIQDAALFALSLGDHFEKKISEPFRRRFQIAKEIIDEVKAVEVLNTRSGMYLMPNIKATGLNGLEFANRLLKEHSIAVMPGESFGQSTTGYLRIAMTIEDITFKRAINTLCKFADELAYV